MLDGLVVCSRGGNVDVEDNNGVVFKCTLRKKLTPVVCGDLVKWTALPGNQGRVEQIVPRRTELTRMDKRGKQQLYAANVDQLIIVVSATFFGGNEASFCYPIDRYSVAALYHDIVPVVVVNKVDLLDEPTRLRALAVLEKYRRLDFRVLVTSKKTNEGIDLLRATAEGKTSIFVGESGVGKSSLIDLLVPDAVRTGAVSEHTGLGRHTTTATTLYHITRSAQLIDSPGVREYDLGVMTGLALRSAIVEFRNLSGTCRFNDCRHISEPACAIRDAVASGKIDKIRYESYRRLVDELCTA